MRARSCLPATCVGLDAAVGLLTLVDVAPPVLELLGVDRPVEMEGRPAEALASGDSLDARVDRLVALNEASRFREQLLFPTTLAVVVVLGLVCAAAIVVLARGASPRVRRVVAFAALADMCVLPLSFLARGLPLEDLGAGFYWAFVSLGALVVAGLLSMVAARVGRARLSLVAVLVLVMAVPLADVMTGSNLSLSAAFGYSPTGNSRLYGISNYSFGMVAAAACLLAAFIADRWPTRRGRAAAVGLLVAVLVVIGMPVFGSDVGGIIAFTPTILVFAALVTGYRMRVRTVAIGLLATVAAVTAFGLVDLARPAGERAHLGRLFERVGNEGLGPLLSIMERKLLANLGVTTSSFWVAMIPLAVAFMLFLSRYPTRPMARMHSRVPTLRAGVSRRSWPPCCAAGDTSGAIRGRTMSWSCVARLARSRHVPDRSGGPDGDEVPTGRSRRRRPGRRPGRTPTPAPPPAAPVAPAAPTSAAHAGADPT